MVRAFQGSAVIANEPASDLPKFSRPGLGPESIFSGVEKLATSNKLGAHRQHQWNASRSQPPYSRSKPEAQTCTLARTQRCQPEDLFPYPEADSVHQVSSLRSRGSDNNNINPTHNPQTIHLNVISSDSYYNRYRASPKGTEKELVDECPIHGRHQSLLLLQYLPMQPLSQLNLPYGSNRCSIEMIKILDSHHNGTISTSPP